MDDPQIQANPLRVRSQSVSRDSHGERSNTGPETSTGVS